MAENSAYHHRCTIGVNGSHLGELTIIGIYQPTLTRASLQPFLVTRNMATAPVKSYPYWKLRSKLDDFQWRYQPLMFIMVAVWHGSNFLPDIAYLSQPPRAKTWNVRFHQKSAIDLTLTSEINVFWSVFRIEKRNNGLRMMTVNNVHTLGSTAAHGIVFPVLAGDLVSSVLILIGYPESLLPQAPWIINHHH